VKREVALEMQDVTQFTALHSSRILTDKFAGPRYGTPLPGQKPSQVGETNSIL